MAFAGLRKDKDIDDVIAYLKAPNNKDRPDLGRFFAAALPEPAMDLMNKYPRLSDLQKPAARRIPKFVFAYLDSGTVMTAPKIKTGLTLTRLIWCRNSCGVGSSQI